MAAKQTPENELLQQIKFLKKIGFFNNFDDHELRQFLAVSRWIKVPPNTLIIKEDTLEKIFYILVKGKVSVFKTDSTTQETVELTTLDTGACFGEMSLVGETRRTAGVITTTESFILVVEPDIISTSNVFLQLKFYKRFCEILVTRLIMANQKMVSRASLPKEIKSREQEAIDQETFESEEMKSEEAPERKKVEATPGRLEEEVDQTLLPPMPDVSKRLTKTTLKRRIHHDLSLPVNRAVIAQLSPFLAEDIENTHGLTELINLDPVLSSKVLQLANSSFFRRSCSVASVAHALVTVGVKHIQEVVTETIAESRDTKPFGNFPYMARSFWLHCIVVGRIAEMLKDIIRLEISQSVYLAGLLHDLGILPLDNIAPHFYPQLLRPGANISNNLFGAERDFIGIDHGQAGAWLAEKMGLPYAYQNVMQHHHNPENAREDMLLVALIHLADLFATSRGITICGTTCHTPPLAESFAWVMIMDQHRPFMEVNIANFIESFNGELNKNWKEITGNILL